MKKVLIKYTVITPGLFSPTILELSELVSYEDGEDLGEVLQRDLEKQKSEVRLIRSNAGVCISSYQVINPQ